MNGLNIVEDLVRAGRFGAALTTLERLAVTPNVRLIVDVLHAELLERTGRHSQSKAIAERLLKSQNLTSGHRSSCESVLALIEADRGGEAGKALKHMQRALLLAENSKDLRRICWCQLRLVITLADISGHQVVAPLLADARANAIKLGDSIVSAALHIFLGEMEARRGLIKNAVRHTRLGQNLLIHYANVWLDGRAENTLVAVAIMLSEYDEGIVRGQRALALAEESGAASLRSAILGNLGNLHYRVGDFSQAVEYFERANAALPFTGERANAYLESLARLCLAQGRPLSASDYLDRIDESIKTPSDELLHANRYAKLTRSEVFVHQHLFGAALEISEQTIALAERVNDHLLDGIARLTKAELLHQVGRPSDGLSILADIGSKLREQPPDVHARYERALGVALSLSGANVAARLHFDHAKRIYQGLRDAPGLLDLNRVAEGALDARTVTSVGNVDAPDSSARNVLEQVAILLLHVGRPELVATALVSILAATSSVVGANAVLRASDDCLEVLHSFESEPLANDSVASERIIAVGSARNRSVEVIVRPRADIESTATLNALTLLLGTVQELEQARADREQRVTLWPVEEISTDDDNAVIMGRLKETMFLAQRVARTNVSVLITGESGTGKEILARAIHRFSRRADKPFVPFNCTAIPRDLLESQLFGHRRGAFTGADRDSLGLIRSAKDGTLFLDEIGELSLDLQPKLLRFLESGEISPLGEPSPFTVDVRIVAATNANVEQLVHQGRFREDLFYRLNVVRLTIPPLRERREEIPALVHHFVARAAAEFSKGRVRLAEETMEHLLVYPWPGNVRQLQNELRRMTALAEPDALLTPAALSPEIRKTGRIAPPTGNSPELTVPLTEKLVPTLARIEGEMIRLALRTHHGRLDAAAKALGISRKGLYLKRQRLGL
jgi:DNA-binding NtrC family response regulator/tetratricopeptide (TPR) repeat protein